MGIVATNVIMVGVITMPKKKQTFPIDTDVEQMLEDYHKRTEVAKARIVNNALKVYIRVMNEKG